MTPLRRHGSRIAGCRAMTSFSGLIGRQMYQGGLQPRAVRPAQLTASCRRVRCMYDEQMIGQGLSSGSRSKYTAGLMSEIIHAIQSASDGVAVLLGQCAGRPHAAFQSPPREFDLIMQAARGPGTPSTSRPDSP